VFESEFLTTSAESQAAYREGMSRAIEVLCQSLPIHPYSGKSAAPLQGLLEGKLLSEHGVPPEELWRRVGTVISESVHLTHPNTAAHLHCPPLIPALAAEVVISALNQSMDSFDQAPAATVLEENMIRFLAHEIGFDSGSSGVFTAGGSQSNYMGLLLARDACLDRRFGWSVQKRGLTPEARKLRILCSDVAHFTVEKSAAQLGLGTESVVRIRTDDEFRMSVGPSRRLAVPLIHCPRGRVNNARQRSPHSVGYGEAIKH
jgi:L-2,4-diaminobutyrate decarboxylase